MFLCRTISLFFFLFSMSPLTLFHKNVSQARIGPNTEVSIKSSNAPGLTSNDPINTTEPYPVNSTEPHLDNDISTRDSNPVLEESQYGAIIEKFINEMEAFWWEIKERLLNHKLKQKPPGELWNETTESKYKAMKAKFFEEIPITLPQKIIDVINEYEMRYNDLMWREIEHKLSSICEANRDEYNNDIPSRETSFEKKEDNNELHRNRDPINANKCTKMNFNDLFEAKICNAGSFSNNNCDE